MQAQHVCKVCNPLHPNVLLLELLFLIALMGLRIILLPVTGQAAESVVSSFEFRAAPPFTQLASPLAESRRASWSKTQPPVPPQSRSFLTISILRLGLQISSAVRFFPLRSRIDQN